MSLYYLSVFILIFDFSRLNKNSTAKFRIERGMYTEQVFSYTSTGINKIYFFTFTLVLETHTIQS